MKTVEHKLNELEKTVKNYKKVAIAFNGGLNSAFLLYFAKKILGKENVVAFTGNSFSVYKKNLEFCGTWTKKLNVKHISAKTNEFMEESYIVNDRMRCYFCKILLFKTMSSYIPKSYIILTGSDAENILDGDRPELFAEKEFNVHSPLRELYFSKEDLSRAAGLYDINIDGKLHAVCMSERIPAGSIITRDKIRMVEDAEDFLEKMGVKDCRVYHYGELAKIDADEYFAGSFANPVFRNEIMKGMKNIGFKHAAVDLVQI